MLRWLYRKIVTYVRRQKRTIFMSTLYLRLLGKKYYYKEDLKECSRRLILTMDPKGLEFPALIANHIWPDDEYIKRIRGYIDNNLMEEAVVAVRSGSPKRLKYCVDNSRDIRIVIRAVARTLAHQQYHCDG